MGSRPACSQAGAGAGKAWAAPAGTPGLELVKPALLPVTQVAGQPLHAQGAWGSRGAAAEAGRNSA